MDNHLVTHPLRVSQPRRLRATIEIVDGALRIFPICDNDADERRILEALRFIGKDDQR